MDNKDEIKIIELKESILEDNDRDAEVLRGELRTKGIFLINLMSAPGSGKTSTLLALAPYFKDRIKWAVMEADIDSDVDARAIAAAGIPSIQLHTGGMCHLDADMTRQGVREIEDTDPELIVLENIGNLVCPAEYDTGAMLNMTILSVPEGDDKPVKYPLMYEESDIMVINKIDTLPVFDFDPDAAEAAAKKLNPSIKVFRISAKTGEGVQELAEYIISKIHHT
ncbi:MAG: hydrogenase nickel incorporation protein HypB [Lachnospiraceae bacterium]|nr:hydrogenase nickel incorporation protein HypB [Lachnospiraceae bacterium]